MGTSWFQFPPELLDKILCEFTPHEFLHLYARSDQKVKDILKEPYRLSVVLKNWLQDDLSSFEWEMSHPSCPEEFTLHMESHGTKALKIIESSIRLSYCHLTMEDIGAIQKSTNETVQESLNKPLQRTSNESSQGHYNEIHQDFSNHYPQNSSNGSLLGSHELNFSNLTYDIQTLGCNAKNYIYTLLEHKRLETIFSRDLEDLENSKIAEINVSRRAWIKYLLHFHQFSCCVEFFHKCDPNSYENIEKAFFQLSRCHLEFSTLAHHRLFKIRAVRKELAKVNAFYSGKIYFNSIQAYYNYLRGIVFIILKKFNPTHYAAPVDGNLLNYYKGETQAPRLLCLAIIAKFLQEDILDKFTLVTREFSLKGAKVKISSHFLIINDTYISVSQEDLSVSVYSRRQIEGTHSKLQMKPVRILDIVESAFNSETSTSPINVESLAHADPSNWSIEKLGTSKERLRFLRTLVVSICRHEADTFASFKPLITNHDFYYYYVGACYILNVPVANFDYNFFAAPTTLKPGHESLVHRIVYNPRSEYLGVVLVAHDNSNAFGVSRQGFFQVVTFDSIESSVALEENLQSVEVAHFPNTLSLFLKWLTCSEGISYACRYCFNVLKVKEGKIECDMDPSVLASIE